MLFVILVSCLMAATYGQLIKPLDAIIFEVAVDADIDGDGFISLTEFETEILAKWANGAQSVTKADFVLNWTTTYQDSPAATEKFFDNMDVFIPYGVINELDLLIHFPTLDTNADGNISTNEFIAFMHKMLFVILVACLVASSYGQMIKPLDAIIFEVANDTDTDHDGLISVKEFETEVLAKWANGAQSVKKADFILMWTTTYQDSPAATEKFFDNMDSFIPFGVINELDLLIHFPTLDSNGDGDISRDEFIAFLHKMHPDGLTLPSLP